MDSDTEYATMNHRHICQFQKKVERQHPGMNHFLWDFRKLLDPKDIGITIRINYTYSPDPLQCIVDLKESDKNGIVKHRRL